MTVYSAPDEDNEQQRIIERARASIEECRRMLAEAGVTPEICLERLRKAEGPQAAERLRQSVDTLMRSFRDQVQRDAMHAGTARPVSRYAVRRSLI